MDWPPYVPINERRKKTLKKINVLRKKTANLTPIIIKGPTIAKTWWGKAWNKNLESYADYANRIERGRSYVRHHAVMDLKIKSGQINALIQGSRRTPYRVIIKIKPLKENLWSAIKTSCQEELDSLDALLSGEFPQVLASIFTNQQTGLFPSPREITFNCSCPDWASMCKHVAATLYGIGARLDDNPELFFILRKVKIKALITGSITAHKETLLEKAKKKSAKIMDNANLSQMFGIDLDLPQQPRKKKPPSSS